MTLKAWIVFAVVAAIGIAAQGVGVPESAHAIVRGAFGLVSLAVCVYYPPSAIGLLILGNVTAGTIARHGSVFGSNQLSLLVVGLLAMLINRRRGELTVPRSVVTGFGIFLLIVLQSELGIRGESLLNLDRFAMYCLALFVALLVKSRRDQAFVAVVLAGAGLAFSLWTVSRASATGFLTTGRGSDEFDANYLSVYIGLGVIPVLVFLVSATHRLRVANRIALWAVVGVDCLATLQLASRGASIALGSTALCLAASRFRHPRQLVQVVVSVALMLAVVSQLDSASNLRYRWGGESWATGNSRVPIATAKLSAWSDSEPWPLIMGAGTGASFRIGSAAWTSTHDSFISFLIDYGLVGLVTIFVLTAIVAVNLRMAPDVWRELGWCMIAFIGLASLSVEPHSTPLPWIAFGLLMPVSRPDNRSQHSPRTVGPGGSGEKEMTR